MKKPELDRLTKQLGELVGLNDSIRRLHEDLTRLYLGDFAALPGHYRQAWDKAVADRLIWIEGTEPKIAALRRSWELESRYHPIGRIHFGQLRIAAKFADSHTEHSIAAVAGRQITAVATEIAAGTFARDLLSVQVFLRGDVWVAINNRGFATHSLAKVRPLRLLPCLPEVAETNRLTETGEDLLYSAGVPRLPKNRTLPSTVIPVTVGQNDLTVLRIITTICP